MPISAARAVAHPGGVASAAAQPERSPLMSAAKTLTPALAKASASTCNVTVLPVPVAPAIRPWRLARLRASACTPSGEAPKSIDATIGRASLPRATAWRIGCFRCKPTGGAKMELSLRGALWIVATGVIVAGLYFLRGPLTQFAMALILWLAIDGLAATIAKHVPFAPRWLALPAALVLVLGLVALTGWVVVINVGAMMEQWGLYEQRLNQVMAQSYGALGIGGVAPTVGDLVSRLDPARVATEIGEGLQNLASDVIFILIFLGFLFPAAG